MYFLIVVVGLACAVLMFPQLTREGKKRRKQYHKKLGMTAILVHTGKLDENKREIVNRYPVASSVLTFGRKPRYSPLRVDIPGPVTDKLLHRKAATFYFNAYGEFCIRRNPRQRIWVSSHDGREICLLKDPDGLKAEEIPPIFTRPGYSVNYDEYSGDFCLMAGDMLLVGNTLLEYVEVDHD